VAVVLLSVTETSGEGMAAFSGESHLPKGGMRMDVGTSISLISLVVSCITFGMQIASGHQMKNDRLSDKD
jgi:hypothetical protein